MRLASSTRTDGPRSFDEPAPLSPPPPPKTIDPPPGLEPSFAAGILHDAKPTAERITIDTARSRPLEAERALESAQARTQHAVLLWRVAVPAMTARAREEGQRDIEAIRKLQGVAEERCRALRDRHRQLEETLAKLAPSSLLVYAGLLLGVFAAVLMVLEVPLVQPIVPRLLRVREDATLVPAATMTMLMGLVSASFGYLLKEVQYGAGGVRAGRIRAVALSVIGVLIVAFSAGLIWARVDSYEELSAGHTSTAGPLLFCGLQFGLVVLSAGAAYVAHSPLKADLAGVEGQLLTAEGDLQALTDAITDREASLVELDAFEPDADAWVGRHQEVVRNDFTALADRFREEVVRCCRFGPDPENRAWVASEIARPTFAIPVVEGDLGDDTLLGGSPKLHLF